MIVIYIKQQLSNIWNSIHVKVKQHWGWVKKGVTYKQINVYPKRKGICNSINFSDQLSLFLRCDFPLRKRLQYLSARNCRFSDLEKIDIFT